MRWIPTSYRRSSKDETAGGICLTGLTGDRTFLFFFSNDLYTASRFNNLLKGVDVHSEPERAQERSGAKVPRACWDDGRSYCTTTVLWVIVFCQGGIRDT